MSAREPSSSGGRGSSVVPTQNRCAVCAARQCVAVFLYRRAQASPERGGSHQPESPPTSLCYECLRRVVADRLVHVVPAVGTHGHGLSLWPSLHPPRRLGAHGCLSAHRKTPAGRLAPPCTPEPNLTITLRHSASRGWSSIQEGVCCYESTAFRPAGQCRRPLGFGCPACG